MKATAQNNRDLPSECQADATVCRQLGETGIPSPPARTPAGECLALTAALSLADAARRDQLRQEFVALTGAAECAALRGLRCGYYPNLAAELVRRYRRRNDPQGKIRVLLLGDSIRCNYENVVRSELGDRYDVVAPAENCRFAKYTLNELERIFQALGEPDVIHWNNGLWDSAVVCPEDGMFTAPGEYCYYMTRILRELRKHTSHVIFATTTPVRDGSLNQHLAYIDRLNAAIVPYMRAQQVPINDLYALVKPHLDEYLSEDCIHLSSRGMAACGAAVAAAIRAECPPATGSRTTEPDGSV